MNELTYATDEQPFWMRICITLIEYALGRRPLQRRYQRVLEAYDSGASYWFSALKQLDATPRFSPEHTHNIPKDGPVVFIANHPFGIMDGLTLCALAEHTRGPFKILINAALCRDSRLDPFFVPVDFSKQRSATFTNARSARTVLNTLKKGGTLVVFPAGGISTAPGWFQPATDLAWNPFVATLIVRSKATVVPVYFPGENSRLFQWASLLNMDLRLAFIMGEVRRQIGKPVAHTIGASIPQEALTQYASDEAVIEALRKITYDLSSS